MDYGTVGKNKYAENGATSSGFNKLGEATQQTNKAWKGTEARTGGCEKDWCKPRYVDPSISTVAIAGREMVMAPAHAAFLLPRIMERIFKQVKNDPT